MKLNDLKSKLPPDAAAWVDQYMPALIAMEAAGNLQAWIVRIVAGDVVGAYSEILDNMPPSAVVDEWTGLNMDWATADDQNSARMLMEQRAFAQLAKILAALAMAALGA